MFKLPMLFNGDPDADLILNHILARGKKKKISLERGPQGEWDPGRAARARAKKVSKLKPFWRARAARRAQDPFHPKDPFQRKLC